MPGISPRSAAQYIRECENGIDEDEEDDCYDEECDLQDEDEAQDKEQPKDNELEKRHEEIAKGPMRAELQYLEKRYTDKGHSYIVEYVEEKIPDQGNRWYDMYALVITYDMDRSNKFVRSKYLQVNSEHLKNLLKDVISSYPGQSFQTQTITVSLPAKSLFHYRKELRQEGTKRFEGQEEASAHLKLLVDFIDKEFEETVRESENLIEQSLMSYDYLWTIFRPGTLVFSYVLGQPRVFKCTNYQYSCGGFPSFTVTGEYVDFDGDQFGTASRNLSIPLYEGVESISDLNVYPLSYHPSPEQLTQRLIARGKTFEDLAGQNLRTYTGIAISGGERYNIRDSRVIVDCKTYHRLNANRAFRVSPLHSAETTDLKRKRALANLDSQLVNKEETILVSLTSDDRLLASAVVRGFSFTDRQWLEFFVDNLAPIDWNPQCFSELVLPDAQKDLVQALVAQHTDRNASAGDFDDIVKGKGKGLIFVLHGPPGVGKTLTAECVAEYARRPLYIVSSGDLGTDAAKLDTQLSRILDMASTWKAVLLIDEADVFLERRSLHDLARNGLVSIFLRVLEYYQGILFMTTNRIRTFDDAFKSRIHVPLKYGDLDVASRKRIWKNFLKKGGQQREAELDESGYDRLAARDLNGRQIKNVIRTAKSLAKYREERLNCEQLEQVVDIQEAFGFDLMEAMAEGGNGVNGVNGINGANVVNGFH